MSARLDLPREEQSKRQYDAQDPLICSHSAALTHPTSGPSVGPGGGVALGEMNGEGMAGLDARIYTAQLEERGGQGPEKVRVSGVKVGKGHEEEEENEPERIDERKPHRNGQVLLLETIDSQHERRYTGTEPITSEAVLSASLGLFLLDLFLDLSRRRRSLVTVLLLLLLTL